MKRALAAGPVFVALLAALHPACSAAPEETTAAPDLIEVMAADDRRGASDADLQTLVGGTLSSEPRTRIAAVRALGRLERPDMVGAILALLDDVDPDGRAMAVFAAAQAVRSTGESPIVVGALGRVAREDSDPTVRGAAATALGRLPLDSAESIVEIDRSLGELLALALTTPAEEWPTRGIARGLEALYRRQSASRAGDAGSLRPATGTIEALTTAAREAPDSATRRFAVSALVVAGSVELSLVESWLGDSDREVRRLALRAIEGEAGTRLIGRAADDPAPTVRIAAWRAARRALETSTLCAMASERLDRTQGKERVEVVAALSDCAEARDLLVAMTAGLENGAATPWHAGVAALQALSGNGEADLLPLARSAAQHAAWQVRAAAAAALADLPTTSAAVNGRPGDETLALLSEFARDAHPNVRVAALRALVEVDPTAARGPAMEALGSDAPELLMVASRILAEAGAPDATGPLAETLGRISASRSETLRDARMALVAAIGTVDESPGLDPLRPYLHDYDPVLAARAAQLVSERTGTEIEAEPEPLEPVPFPDRAELERFDELDWVVILPDRGEFVIRLWPWQAPTNAARFARLAEAGTFDGLTFHRVVANFVVQGLSPGANEYTGYPRYSRDEIGPEPHLRGTVGLSTRGRDTGDGQIFVNLVDNYRLDFEYTLFGEVVEGMEAVDAILAGDVVSSVRARSR